MSIGEYVPADMAFMTKLVVIATYLQIGLFAIAGLTLWLQRYRDKKLQEEDMARISVINFVEIGCRMIKSIVSQEETVRLDRCHFQKYGDFALIYETVYWIETPDYVEYMDIQERINLAIHEKFEQENIEFAYPTQTIFLNREANQSFPHQPQPKTQPTNSEPKA